MTESRNWGTPYWTALIATPWLENKLKQKCLPLVCLFYTHNLILEVSCLTSLRWFYWFSGRQNRNLTTVSPRLSLVVQVAISLSIVFCATQDGIALDTCPVGRRVKKSPIKRRQISSVHIPQCVAEFTMSNWMFKSAKRRQLNLVSWRSQLRYPRIARKA